MEEGEYIGDDLDDLSFSDPPSVVPFLVACPQHPSHRVTVASPTVDFVASPIRPAHLTAKQDASTPVPAAKPRDVHVSPINLDASLSNSWMLYKFLQNGTFHSLLVIHTCTSFFPKRSSISNESLIL